MMNYSDEDSGCFQNNQIIKLFFLFFVALIGGLVAIDRTLHEALEGDGVGRLKLHLLASDRVGEAELEGMETQTVQGIVVVFTTIAAITNNGMP